MLSGGSPDEERISIFSTVASYSLPVSNIAGREYIGLLEALEPLGKVSAKAGQKRWRLRYNNAEIEFNLDKTRVKMKGGDFELGAPFVMQNDRGMVPVSVLGPLLARILGGPVTYSPASRRIFIGDVQVHFTAQLTNAASPTLVMNFSAPVNPTIATEAGKLRMTFDHEPVVSSGTQTLTFGDKIITSATYQDGNGDAVITVSGTAPLFAAFGNGRRTISITAAPSAASVARGAATPGSATAPATGTEANSLSSGYLVVIDAAHGGADRGAALGGQWGEKDATLAFAVRVQQELESRGITTLQLRNRDADVSLDQRAAMTNAAHASLYVCIHVTSQGSGVNLYTALLPVGSVSRGAFLDWNTAQAPSLTRSQAAMAILASSFDTSKIHVRTLQAPLRPLNNITTAAVAIEISPPPGETAALDSPEYQRVVAFTIATGIAEVRDKMGSAP